MKEKKDIPWELIISTAFSGFGITVLSWLKDVLIESFTIKREEREEQVEAQRRAARRGG